VYHLDLKFLANATLNAETSPQQPTTHLRGVAWIAHAVLVVFTACGNTLLAGAHGKRLPLLADANTRHQQHHQQANMQHMAAAALARHFPLTVAVRMLHTIVCGN